MRRSAGSIQMIHRQISPQNPSTAPVRIALKKNMIGKNISNTKLSSTVPNTCPVKNPRILNISFMSRVIIPVDDRSKKSRGRFNTLLNM